MSSIHDLAALAAKKSLQDQREMEVIKWMEINMKIMKMTV